ncbi:alpha-amylase [Labilibaculum sp. DW002]|uniref:Alpha-amylase n=1 Tax=Paralabilibaculum antarcticum TaxID=2912572 RepID=A0ABT5VVJ8_9BACT|nr:alpha-amylase family glycosyl hydrolase [Labilibaculum sp. DW002]MDE5419422.1 alpha-amylase [Labilibaculum sp. DW002]
MKKLNQIVLGMAVLAGMLAGCQNKPAAKAVAEEMKTEKPLEWSRNANIYEVNIRQYTPEGTLNAFAKHMPRLKEMGVDILWLMPVYPISEKNRKGSMGSYYAVADYQAVNPEFGTMDDLKSLVKQAHDMGMKVILDWVANHTGWDNIIMKDHKDWYTQNEKGEIVIPEGTDWSDTADLNYENQEMRKYMIESLKFWLTNADVDGFRCDVAGMVPTDFWEAARKELDAVKPVFMLAEDGGHELLENAFDMGYGWDFHHIMNDVVKGKKTANDMEAFFTKIDTVFPADSYLMNFITNHDENSWNGTIEERMGEGGKAFAVLTFTMPGMPLIYSGQEAGMNKRLKFFEKDEIDWSNETLAPFYKQLLSLKSSNKALQNGIKGGKIVRIPSDKNEAVYAFTREAEGNKVIVILNLGKEPVKATLEMDANAGNYACYKDGNKHDLAAKLAVDMKAWEYRVYVK